MPAGDYANAARHLSEAARLNPDLCAVKIPVCPSLPARLIRCVRRWLTGKEETEIRYRCVTLGELDKASDAAAARFAQRGITAGTKTLLLARPGFDLLSTMFALLKLGAVPVAIDPGMGFGKFLGCVANTRPEAVAGIRAGLIISRIFWKTFRTVKVRVPVAGGRAAALPAPRSLSSDSPAAILFTSGSTGAPKGAVQTHAALDAQVALVRSAYGIRAGDVDFAMLPVFALFDPALGTTAVIPEFNPSRPAAADAARIVRAFQQNRVTYSFGSPVLWRKIADYCDAAGSAGDAGDAAGSAAGDKKPITLPDVRVALAAGAPVPVALLRRLKRVLPNAKIHTPYGATEVLPVTSIEADEVLGDAAGGTFRETLRGNGTCVGRPLNGVEVKIIAPADGVIPTLADARELPAGSVGEIIVRSPAMSLEYANNAGATAAAKIGDAGGLWHRMGDMGRLDAAGRLWFYGRKAEVVHTAGGAVYTESVEAVFNQHRRVLRTALIGFGERGEQVPAVVVEPVAGEFPRTEVERKSFEEELLALGATVEATRGITQFFFQQRLPVDTRHNAKIHRLSLARKYANHPLRERR